MVSMINKKLKFQDISWPLQAIHINIIYVIITSALDISRCGVRVSINISEDNNRILTQHYPYNAGLTIFIVILS